MSDTALNVVLAIASLVVSTEIAYALYVRAKKEPLPVYVVTGNTVVRSHAERNIEVRYRGRDVPVVTRTVITFWNAGRQPIRRDDIVKGHPLTVVLPDGARVLEAQPIAATRPDIDFLVGWGTPRVTLPDCTTAIPAFLSFSFLNHRDGGAVEILHTGDDPFAVEVDGAIIGVNGPPRRIQTPLWDDPFGTNAALLLAAVSGVAALTVAVSARNLWSLFFFGIAVTMAVTGYASWRRDRRRVPAPLRGSLGSSGFFRKG